MITIPKGTKDVLPKESYKWHYVEDTIRKITRAFGISEIRTPVFEHTELFLRGVGETTDIVNKEMYTFNDKGNRNITLKPEGTAGVARSFIENNLAEGAMPVKMYYLSPVFRYERPQSGRLREHHQFGVELYGSSSPYADAEAILVARTLFDKIGITGLEFNINSIGCKDCRPEYNKALIAYYESKKGELCPLCNERLYKNPLRILDCKEEKCTEINKGAPEILDFLCPDCRSHHEKLKYILSAQGVAFKVNPRVVRGLDYYTKTVFEFISTAIGAQGTICGGGRYDNLVEEVGGKSCPAVGFGMGLERLIMVAEAMGLSLGKPEAPQIYIAPLGDAQRGEAFKIVNSLRERGIAAETDLMGRSLKSQMKFADKTGALYVAVLGEDEIKSGVVRLKDMSTGAETELNIDKIAEYIGAK